MLLLDSLLSCLAVSAPEGIWGRTTLFQHSSRLPALGGCSMSCDGDCPLMTVVAEGLGSGCCGPSSFLGGEAGIRGIRLWVISLLP